MLVIELEAWCLKHSMNATFSAPHSDDIERIFSHAMNFRSSLSFPIFYPFITYQNRRHNTHINLINLFQMQIINSNKADKNEKNTCIHSFRGTYEWNRKNNWFIKIETQFAFPYADYKVTHFDIHRNTFNW